jgi:PAS domain S-box-containing protein
VNKPVKVLIVEDSEDDAKLALRALRRGGFDPTYRRVQTAAELETALAQERWDAVILDFKMPGFTGMDALRIFRSTGLDIPVILISGTIGEETAVDAMKAGANDYVMKKSLARLAPALERELKETQMRAAHRRTQRDLIESEQRFRSLTEMSSDFYWESDTEHRLTHRASADKKVSTVSVFRQGAQIGERRWEIPYLLPDEAGWQAHRAVLDAHRPFREFELSRLGTDGAERHISISGDPVFDESGAFKGYRGVGKDITERVRGIDDLRRLRAAMDAIADAIYLVDRTSMSLIYVNDAACRMQSRAREELLALGPDGVLSMPREVLERTYDSIIAGGRGAEPVEMQRQRKDGSQVWVELVSRAQRSSEGWMIITVVRDITERKRADEALHESESSLREAQEVGRVGSYVLDVPGDVWRSSAMLDTIFGIGAEFPRTMVSWMQTVHPTEREQMASYLRDIIAAHRRFEREYRIVRANDGAERWVFGLGVVEYDADGAALRMVGTIQDITERKQAGQELRESERRFSDMLGNVALVSVMLDREERITYCNEHLLHLTGWRQEEVIGRTWSELFVLPEINDRKDAFAALLANRPEARHRENEILTRSGERRLIRWNNSLLRSGAGDVIGTASIGEDITEQKRAEAWLHKLSHAVEQSPAATAITDTHGRFEYVNPKFVEVTGYTQEELVGETPALIKSGFTLPDVYEDLWRTILSGREWRGEIQNRRKNGELYWEYEIISPLKNEHGEIVNFIAIKEDITERKRTEAALQQEHASLLKSQQELFDAHESLAEANRLESAGRLAAGVAHEVKNPLGIIRLGTDYLAKQFSQESNQEVLDDIRAAIDRAEHVIRDLLDFSRQKAFAPRPTNINDVIDNALHLIKHEIERRNMVIIRNRDDLMPPIYADPDRLVQVFINLLSNAAQAIGGDGSIEIVTRSICLSERDLEQAETSMLRIGEPVVTVDIRDSGPGISAEHENKLFEPFFTTKPVGEGTGLGLAVSRSIVVLHRGSISISNRPEGGASALLMLRVAREHLTNEKANTGSR